MSTEMPPIEARVRAQEHMTTILHARIEELAQDMGASFQQLVAYQIGFEQKVDARFDRIESTMATKEDIVQVNANITGVKTDMATMEGRILDAFHQLVTMIDTRLPPAIDR